MKITRIARISAIGAIAALALSGCAANEAASAGSDQPAEGATALEGTLKATGASSQSAAQEAWVAAFQTANTGVTINYEPTGSGAGRENFLAGASDFIGSDRAFKSDEFAAGGFQMCTSDAIVEVPMYISPVAVAFNLEGIDSLNLDAASIAGIFAGKITNWNDKAIADQNEGVDLPDLAISPVHRSDPSGTQETFTKYLSATAGDVWTFEPADVWPITSGEAAQGTSGVVQAIKAGNGAIGFADASQTKDLGQVHVGVDGEYVPYSADAAAALVENSPLAEGRGAGDLVFEVDPAAAPAGAYPIALVSYLIACEQYEDTNKAALVKSYFQYMASEEGQKAAEDNAGSAPISAGLRDKVLAAIDTIKVD
ncbi:Phosphate ABC transporter, periplasmic phosphate-binding protein PstS (TC 3.A.1.7.1) [Microbacterium esteraromaticum]|uniref:Phosphate-binding protein n=1 Tax=Microbacterium esteraromaticum TaxID=57043 RepID=A0A1R4I737_9MICO|nr:phosphate ABC transporter substrate-binding protein PstS [Microbacterium esteraromaticum]SJN15424.1 Phosphate ABC transporter, periplasmic phosphate-binding protein PstS (TC 3.A.1.7.1) [Microbacterium esteraromaticum]